MIIFLLEWFIIIYYIVFVCHTLYFLSLLEYITTYFKNMINNLFTFISLLMKLFFVVMNVCVYLYKKLKKMKNENEP